MATPLLLVLLVVELSDVVFAVDSIPAVRPGRQGCRGGAGGRRRRLLPCPQDKRGGLRAPLHLLLNFLAGTPLENFRCLAPHPHPPLLPTPRRCLA